MDKSGISENKELLRADLVAKAYDISHKTGYKQKELIVNKAAGDRIKLNIQLEKI